MSAPGPGGRAGGLGRWGIEQVRLRPGLSLPRAEGDLLILGDGRSTPADLKAYAHRGPVMAVNMSGLLWPGRLDHWVTCHPDVFFAARDFRPARWQDRATLCHAGRPSDRADVCWQFARGRDPAWSGGLALLIALALGFGQGRSLIVLAGCSLDDSGHYYAPQESFHGLARFRSFLEQAHRAGLLDNVRAVSGWAAELLGQPPGLAG